MVDLGTRERSAKLRIPTRHSRESGNPQASNHRSPYWTPAFAGMTKLLLVEFCTSLYPFNNLGKADSMPILNRPQFEPFPHATSSATPSAGILHFPPTRNSALDFSLHDNGLSMWKDAGADVILTGDSASTILPSVQPYAPLLNRRIHGVQSRSVPSAPCLEPGGACVRAGLNWTGLTWHRWLRSTRRRAVNFGSRVAQYRAPFSDSADFSAHLTAGTDPVLLLPPSVVHFRQRRVPLWQSTQ